MKKILMGITVATALMISHTAAADNWNHRGGYNSYSYSNHYRSYGRHRAYDYYPGRYNARHYRGNRVNISYGNHYYRRHDHDASYFVGGLVLGSLLSYPRYSAPPVERVVYRSVPVVQTREVVVVKDSAASRRPVASGRRLLRDLEGNCFERFIDEDGNEIRVQLDASECSF